MNVLRWIWAYLFDCVHRRTTWPHQNRFGHAYVCCLDCGREMAYSLEYMQIVREGRTRNTWDLRLPATASLIIAGALLLLTPSYAVAETAQPSAFQSQTVLTNRNIAPMLVIGFVGGFVHKDELRHSEVQLARHLQKTYRRRIAVEVFTNRQGPVPMNRTLAPAHDSSFCRACNAISGAHIFSFQRFLNGETVASF